MATAVTQPPPSCRVTLRSLRNTITIATRAEMPQLDGPIVQTIEILGLRAMAMFTKKAFNTRMCHKQPHFWLTLCCGS